MHWKDPNPTIRIRGVDVPVAQTINEVLGRPHVSNVSYKAKLEEMDMRWLRDTLIVEEFRDQVYWPNTEGITITYFTVDARRWLNLVSHRIRLSDNLIDVIYPPTLVVACTIQGIQLNLGAQIVSEWKGFYRGNKKAFFFLSLVSAL